MRHLTPHPIPRPAAFLTALALVTLALASSPQVARAQTITQTHAFLGWTSTGNEVVSRVTVGAKGINDQGDPVDWSYTVMEVASATTAKVLNTYKIGAPSGQPQPSWEKAKSEADGKKILKSLGLIEGVRSDANPTATRAIVTVGGSAEGDTVITDTCPGCATCESYLKVLLVHRDDKKVYTVRERTREGNPYPPGGSVVDCPTLEATTWWHPEGDRFAIVFSDTIESNGTVLQTLSVYDPEQDASGWTGADIENGSGPGPRERRKAELKKILDTVGSVTDPAGKARLLTRAGDLKRLLGDADAARGFYDAALQFDKKSLHARLGQANLELAAGNERAAVKIARRVERKDRRANALSAELGLFYLVAGDRKRAAKHLQASVDVDGGADYGDRVDLGMRILEANLDAGMAYMDNLLGAVPDNPDARLEAALKRAHVRMAEESIHVRDYEAAARYIGRLDKKSPEAARLALTYTALTSRDPSKIRLALDKTEGLLQQDPTRCPLYFVRAMAYRRAVKPAQVLSNLAAAVACDPSQSEAHFYLGDLRAAASRFDAARHHFETFLELAPPRLGDRARTLRRQHVERMLPRLRHKGVVLLSYDCSLRSSDLRCRGVLSNTTAAASGPVPILLTSRTDGRRSRVVHEGKSQIPDVSPGATLDFAVTIPKPEDGEVVELTLGRSEAEKGLNKTVVEVY